MSKSLFSISVLAATMFMTPAFAVDGTTLINQATVLGAGGFPYHITQSGSYRLSGNLVAANSTAIVISGTNVTLDLNGFTISCSACIAVPGVLSTTSGTTIQNGTVTGFLGGGGIGVFFQGTGAKVDHVTAAVNTTGIVTQGATLTVTNSNISNNTFDGVSGQGSTLTILDNVISSNGQDGIDIQTGLISRNTIDSNGATGSFTRGGIIVFGGIVNITNNLISNSGLFGVSAIAGTPTIGLGSNTFAGNPQDWTATSHIISQNNNVCSGGLC
jgi:hypothetical protein